MATFTYDNITYTALFLDPSAGSNGSGVSTSDPLNTLPTFSTIAANTALIIRRTATSIVFTAGQTNGNANIIFAGSPRATDPLYYVVPNASDWESDVPDTATISITGNSTASGIRFDGANIYVENLTLSQTSTGGNQAAGTSAILHISSVSPRIRKTNINVAGFSYDNTGTYGGIYRYAVLSKCENFSMSDCYIEVPNGGVHLLTAANNINISNTIIKNYASTGQSYSIFNTGGSYRYYGCKIYNKSNVGQKIYHGASSSGEVTNCTIVDEYLSANGTSFYNQSGSCNIINSVFYSKPRGGTGIRYMLYIGASNNIIKGCIFETQDDQSTDGDNIAVHANGDSQFYDCIFNIAGMPFAGSTHAKVISNCTLSGNILTQIPLFVENITAFKNASASYPISVINKATLYMGTLTMSHVPTTNRRFNLNSEGNIFIDNLDVFLGTGSAYSYLNFNGNEKCAIYTKNEVTVGNWNARSLKTYMNTTNTYRSSGKNYSIKCQSFAAPTTSTLLPYLWIAPLPFAGIPVTFGTTGQKKIIMYFAHKLYDTNGVTRNDLILQADIPDSSSPSGYTTVSSYDNFISIADSSVWNNDTGLTAMRLELPFNLTTAGEVRCRIGFFKYNASYQTGYVVVDTGLIGSDI